MLLVSELTQKLTDGFWRNCSERLGTNEERSDWILVAVQILLWMLGHSDFFAIGRQGANWHSVVFTRWQHDHSRRRFEVSDRF